MPAFVLDPMLAEDGGSPRDGDMLLISISADPNGDAAETPLSVDEARTLAGELHDAVARRRPGGGDAGGTLARPGGATDAAPLVIRDKAARAVWGE